MDISREIYMYNITYKLHRAPPVSCGLMSYIYKYSINCKEGLMTHIVLSGEKNFY